MQQRIKANEKRILHIVTGLGNGGAEGALYRLTTSDKASIHRVIVLRDEGKYGALLRDSGVEVLALNMRFRTAPLALVKIVQIVRSWKPDVVQTWLYHADVIGGLAARVAGHKNISWSLRNAAMDSSRAKKSTMTTINIAVSLSKIIPHRIVSCSKRASRDHVALGYPSKKIMEVPNGYDLSKNSGSKQGARKIRREFDIADSTFLIGMVARWDPQKDHRSLIAAVRSIVIQGLEVRLLLAGPDMDENNSELLKIINEYGLDDQVILAGQRRDIPEIMSSLDLHVLSSAYGEGFPNVVAEAMACETLCVATDVGDTSVILGGNGQLTSPGNSESLRVAIAEMQNLWVSDPRAYAKSGEEARQHIIENFDIQVMVDGFHQAWESSVEARSKGN